MSSTSLKIALVGNPNIGKTTLFNALCGLNQKTGNYPGVTVDQTRGYYTYADQKIEVIDLPGVNSIYPQSTDEKVVYDYLTKSNEEDLPDKLVVVVSALNFKRNLYLFHQTKDLGLPVVLVVNMIDAAKKRGIKIDTKKLEEKIGCQVYAVSAKTGDGLDILKVAINNETPKTNSEIESYLLDIPAEDFSVYSIKEGFKRPFRAFLDIIVNKKDEVVKSLSGTGITSHKLRVNESILRYKTINTYLEDVYQEDKTTASDLSSKLDKWFLHPVWGYVIFLGIMFLVFQSIFSFAQYPMDWIDTGMASLSDWLSNALPKGYLSDLLSKGLVPGIGGVVVFVPQIVILFLYFSILEETGYMTRVVFLTDKLMQRFGMSGKSIVPLISGFACAIPSIMSARTIEHKKERLITILIAPLMTCSARIPVYIALITVIVPNTYVGPFGLQGLVMLGMYLLGIFAGLLAAMVFKFILKNEHKSYLILEMPQYLLPSLKNVGISVWTNAWSFITNAGKIIIATSIILFVLLTNGGNDFQNADQMVRQDHPELNGDSLALAVAGFEMEHSYLGVVGKGIEPAIAPLGYDWKIGIALVTSLAAREVFIGTMAVIYNINSEDSEEPETVAEYMKNEVNASTGEKTFNIATSISLLLFYAFALQCFSTVAVTYKETKSLKWTLIQFAYMGVIAYLAAFTAFQTLA